MVLNAVERAGAAPWDCRFIATKANGVAPSGELYAAVELGSPERLFVTSLAMGSPAACVAVLPGKLSNPLPTRPYARAVALFALLTGLVFDVSDIAERMPLEVSAMAVATAL